MFGTHSPSQIQAPLDITIPREATASCPSESVLAAEASDVLDEVRRALQRQEPNHARVAALRLVDLLNATLKACPAKSSGGLAPWQKSKVERHLRAHLDLPLRLIDLAALVPLSVGHFCKAFRQSFGVTPHTFIMRLRLELAQSLILTSREPLSQIALASGLADQAHLTKLFQRSLGETPGAWRRRHLSDPETVFDLPDQRGAAIAAARN